MEYLPAPRVARPSPAAEAHVWRASRGAVPSDRTLRRVLALYLEEQPEAIELAPRRARQAAPRGRARRLAFNLSHSGDLALVAVSRGREVGVDVERVKPERDLVAARRAGARRPRTRRRCALPKRSERTRLFYELWTRHEARLKCLGVGLAGTPTWPSPPVAVESLPIDPGYAAAVAVTGDRGAGPLLDVGLTATDCRVAG